LTALASIDGLSKAVGRLIPRQLLMADLCPQQLSMGHFVVAGHIY
jgi:hypothetical protein